MPGKVKSIQKTLVNRTQNSCIFVLIMLNGLIRLPVVNKIKLVGKSYDAITETIFINPDIRLRFSGFHLKRFKCNYLYKTNINQSV